VAGRRFRAEPYFGQHPFGVGVGPVELHTGDDAGQFGDQGRELIMVSALARTRSMTVCGVRCQSSPDSSTLVSMTTRTLPPFGPICLYLRIDLVHRHRLDTSGGHAIGDPEQGVRDLPAFDCIGDQPGNACGVSMPASLAVFAVSPGSSIRILVIVLLPQNATNSGRGIRTFSP
jgi:hypothetical protein